METNSNKETKACIFQWKIENASQCWWLNADERLESPTFIANAPMSTKWTLWLYPNGYQSKTRISFFLLRAADCSGPDLIEVNFHLAFLGRDGSLLVKKIFKHIFSKFECEGSQLFERRKRVFVTEKDVFLPEDTLTVQCTIENTDETPIKTDYLYGLTSLKINRKSFNWKINYCSTLKTGARYEFKDALFDFDFILNADFDTLDLKMISCHDWVKYISFNVFVLEAEGTWKNCGFRNVFASHLKNGKSVVLNFPEELLEDKSRYLPNDLLSLHIEFVFSTIEDFGCGKNVDGSKNYTLEVNECLTLEEKSQNALLLIQDFNSLYNDGIFTDTELRTSTKSFPVHKNILSARSPVFRRMFSSDMREANSGHVDIIDFEDDTVHRMLLYIYAGTLEDLHFENASELYKIADKYQILSLKSSCSTFLKVNMCHTKVCDILMLADLCQDIDLKNAAEVYIMEHDGVFNSLEWKNFMDSNLKLAADIMYKKVNTVRIC